ncbi:cytochrome C [Halarcobacter mediterraneus]|uniref:Cytochrome C n=1 Tax=Halarcobacter mediterraneus TaxID=2023153 RepID=A0A4Q1AVS5_9BACT|nr:c-type cytochrome [Halarcobacter mediterraneus]RXK11510.1 cytochrome C [Halarcobacter mediterraneus]
MKKIVLGTMIVAGSLMAANWAPCAACHGAKAEKKALGKSHVIAGWPVEKTVAALKGYKDGSYGGAMKGVMKGQTARLSDADIQDLAKQIAAF